MQKKVKSVIATTSKSCEYVIKSKVIHFETIILVDGLFKTSLIESDSFSLWQTKKKLKKKRINVFVLDDFVNKYQKQQIENKLLIFFKTKIKTDFFFGYKLKTVLARLLKFIFGIQSLRKKYKDIVFYGIPSSLEFAIISSLKLLPTTKIHQDNWFYIWKLHLLSCIKNWAFGKYLLNLFFYNCQKKIFSLFVNKRKCFEIGFIKSPVLYPLYKKSDASSKCYVCSQVLHPKDLYYALIQRTPHLFPFSFSIDNNERNKQKKLLQKYIKVFFHKFTSVKETSIFRHTYELTTECFSLSDIGSRIKSFQYLPLQIFMENDTSVANRKILQVLRQRNGKNICVQHGLYSYLNDINHLSSDFSLIWQDYVKHNLLVNGISSKRILFSTYQKIKA